MKKIVRKKLSLSRETIQKLAEGKLTKIVGGCAGSNNCTGGVNCQMF